MTIDIKKDLEIIEAATDGPWASKSGLVLSGIMTITNDPLSLSGDIEHIAHFNPSHCKELVTALKESEADREKLDKSLREVFKAWQECYSQFERPALFERVKELLER